MINPNHIDVSHVLRTSVCELYSNLVTRPTGAAVRNEIEQQLSRAGDREVIVIDFSHVALLDFSCADEIVAKLLLQYTRPAPPRDVYFVFRGMSDSHLYAIEAVLERHGLVLVSMSENGEVGIVGHLDNTERQAWEIVYAGGASAASELASAAGISADEAERVLEGLCRRRLVIREEGCYIPVRLSA